MSDFKREFRYYVIKRRDITSDQEVALQDTLHGAKIPCQESVVVENDWPNYEHTWATIQRVSDGTYDDPYAENERLRARVAELEIAILNAVQAMPGGQAKADLRDVYDAEIPTTAWLLRKQSEAVEGWANDQHLPPEEDLTELGWHAKRIYGRAKDHAQRLRQQADEAERAGGEQ